MRIRNLMILLMIGHVLAGCSDNQFKTLDAQVKESSSFASADAAEDNEAVEVVEGKDFTTDDFDFSIDPSLIPSHQPDDIKWPDEGEVHPPEPDEPEDEEEVPAPEEKEISEKGRIKPTVYYFPVINEDKKRCTPEWRIRDEKGKIMMTVCESTRAACRLQGTCAIVQKGKLRTFNIEGEKDGIDRFFEISKESCRFGFGVKKACLDPFYTLAADMTIYKPGEVIYIPAVVGLELPDGSRHTGYFVIRDTGDKIIGRGRFDFYSGHMSWRDDNNPFKKIGLASKQTRFPYFRVKGERAKEIREERNFPKLPAPAPAK